MLTDRGERISMACGHGDRHPGLEARSFTGLQAGVITDATHGRARINRHRPSRIARSSGRRRDTHRGGFQGVCRRRPRTSRRWAAVRRTPPQSRRRRALNADAARSPPKWTACSRRPRIVRSPPGGSRGSSYEEDARDGGLRREVLMLRCVEYARRYGVPIHVRCP